MTALGSARNFGDRGAHEAPLAGMDQQPVARGSRRFASLSTFQAVSLWLAAALAVYAAPASMAAEPAPLKIAVFDFELEDGSAGGGVIAVDETDTENLRLAAEEARDLLEASGRYKIVDIGAAADEVVSAGGIRHCNGCEGPLARQLGADRSMAGIVKRITRTEYTLQIFVRDTRTGEVLSNAFTGLRMGANYSWPRGVKWLMTNRILSQTGAQ